MAAEERTRGNAAFTAGRFDDAIRHFTAGISLSPTDHILSSNRSAAYASLGRYDEALTDARKTVALHPRWAKGYSRLGAARLGLDQPVAAVVAYQAGLDIEPSNAALASGLAAALASAAASSPSSPFRRIFQSPAVWAKLMADPTARSYSQQSDFVWKIEELQKNPGLIHTLLADRRVEAVLEFLENLEPEPHTIDLTADDDEEELIERRARAQREKETGNDEYKKRNFAIAIKHYTLALDLDDQDISFLTNRAAAFLEMGKYEECIEDCDKAVEKGRELHSDLKMIERALTRKGTALVKLAKCSKDYEMAIEIFQKALTEHHNPITYKKLIDAERTKDKLEQKEYSNPKLPDEEQEKGNQYFKHQNAHEAVKHYTEALRRNPRDPKIYSDRAACYIKLGSLLLALKDAEKCIELDHTFIEGYTRKGTAQFMMKEYDKALETYQEGLKLDGSNQALMDGICRCTQEIKTNRGAPSRNELKERQAKGMQNPEIQYYLSDPEMRQILLDIQDKPLLAKEHMEDPFVVYRLLKLLNSGIVPLKR